MKPRAKEWAPKELVELYCGRIPPASKRSSALLNTLRKDDLLTKFVTHHDMEPVWKTLRNRWEKSSSSKNNQDDITGAALLYACQDLHTELLSKSKETSAERKATLKKIAVRAAELKRLIQNSGYFLDCQVERFMEDAEIISCFRAIAPNPNRFSASGKLTKWDDSMRVIWLRSILELPHLPELLARFSVLASRMAKTPQYSRQAGAEDAGARFLAMGVSGYFDRTYGEPFDAHVAAITNVIMGSDLNSRSVRALRNYKVTSGKTKIRKILND